MRCRRLPSNAALPSSSAPNGSAVSRRYAGNSARLGKNAPQGVVEIKLAPFRSAQFARPHEGVGRKIESAPRHEAAVIHADVGDQFAKLLGLGDGGEVAGLVRLEGAAKGGSRVSLRPPGRIPNRNTSDAHIRTLRRAAKLPRFSIYKSASRRIGTVIVRIGSTPICG